MKTTTGLITTAVLALAAGGAMMTTDGTSAAHEIDMEKCYGVARAGGNDCATASSSCAGTSTEDRQSDAYITLPSGTCNRLAGSSLSPS